jgi:hypothetical protein
MRRLLPALVLATLAAGNAGPASGQRSLSDACAEVAGQSTASCLLAAQAAASTQGRLAALAVGGNPTPGAAAASGLRLGVLPRTTVSLRAAMVAGQTPDLRAARIEPTDAVRFGERSLVLPALTASAAVELTRGYSVAPTLGGIGSLDLLADASWLPLHAAADDFQDGSAAVAWGAGVRVGLLRESFGVPGASLSVLHHRMGIVEYGSVCPGGVGTTSRSAAGLEVEEGVCTSAEPSGIAAYSTDLRSWSARGVVAKHFGGLGLAAGVGYDRTSGTVGLAARPAPGGFGTPDLSYARVGGAHLRQGRWSGFVDGSWSILVSTIAVEAGWLTGSDPVEGYPRESSDFDPGDGSFFGSVGLRVAL